MCRFEALMCSCCRCLAGADPTKGYYTKPPCEELMGMEPVGLSQVMDFTVGRTDFGTIRWLGLTDIRGLPLDDLVSIEDNEVCCCCLLL